MPPLSQIEEILWSLIGTPQLPLTPFSAKKFEGKKLYEYAREWKPIFLTIPMTIYGYKLIDYQFPILKLKLHVGSGTYIRSIAYRIGTQIGGDAILTSLRRTSIWPYSLDDFTKNTIHAGQWDEKEVKYSILEYL
jgi:tRNA pseudouridine55 synthase